MRVPGTSVRGERSHCVEVASSQVRPLVFIADE